MNRIIRAALLPVVFPAAAGIASCLLLAGAASAQSAAGKPSTPAANAAAKGGIHRGTGGTAPPVNAVARSLGVAGPAAVPAPPLGIAPPGDTVPGPAAAPSVNSAANPGATGAWEAPQVAGQRERNTVTGAETGRTPTPSPTGPIIVIPSTPPAP